MYQQLLTLASVFILPLFLPAVLWGENIPHCWSYAQTNTSKFQRFRIFRQNIQMLHSANTFIIQRILCFPDHEKSCIPDKLHLHPRGHYPKQFWPLPVAPLRFIQVSIQCSEHRKFDLLHLHMVQSLTLEHWMPASVTTKHASDSLRLWRYFQVLNGYST